MRHDLHFEFAALQQPSRQAGGPHEAADDFAHTAKRQQAFDGTAIASAGNDNDGQIARALLDQAVEQWRGNADIAETTGGKYWAAENGESLQKAYAAIDAMEKTRIDSTEYTNYTERFVPFAAAGGVVLLAELFLAGTALRRAP